MKHTYIVQSRGSWERPSWANEHGGWADLSKKFGDKGSIHMLSDLEVVEAIMTYGRAEIRESDGGIRILEFQNDYD